MNKPINCATAEGDLRALNNEKMIDKRMAEIKAQCNIQ